jgi:predicted aldo/keto reductase-like oxidoreductase
MWHAPSACYRLKEGFAASLTEAATPFAISHSAMGTILVGMATAQQFEDALIW